MTKVRQIARAAAVLVAAVACVLPPRADGTSPKPDLRTAAPIPHSASSRPAPHLSSPAVALTPMEATVAEMCRNDPVNNFDPLGLETAYENYYEPLGWFGRFEYGVLNLASFGTLAKNDRLVARMERGEISAGQWRSASFGNGAVAIGELGLMVGTGGGSTIASGARVGLAVGITDVLGTRANYSGHAIAYEQSVAGDGAEVLLTTAVFSMAGYCSGLYPAPVTSTALDPVSVRHYARWVPASAEESGFVSFRSDYAAHLKLRDMSVRRSQGIGGAHNLTEFNRYAENLNIIRRTAHPTQPGIYRIEYQIQALDRAGKPTGVFKSKVFSKTVYDPCVIADEAFATWGRQAAAEARATGRLTPEWVGTAPNGLQFRGYLDSAGAVRSFFPEF